MTATEKIRSRLLEIYDDHDTKADAARSLGVKVDVMQGWIRNGGYYREKTLENIAKAVPDLKVVTEFAAMESRAQYTGGGLSADHKAEIERLQMVSAQREVRVMRGMANGPIGIPRLARETGLEEPHVRGVLDSLVEDEMVKRHVNGAYELLAA